VVALLETARHWLTRGGGVAAGLSASLCPESAGDEWEQEYETFDELREVWVQHRARLMEITKLCTCLVPVAAANAAATRVAQTCALVQAGGALDQTKASQTPSVDASGRSALDDAAGAAFEGATSFVEPVMQALPFGDAADGSNLTASGTANTQVIAAIAPALDAMLSNALAVTLASPVGVSQMSRLLEALGRAALARPEAGAAILNRLFEILGHLPSDDAAAPPARAKAALMAGRTAQAARQRVCAAVLGVCTAAPQVRLRRSRMIVFFPVSRPLFFLNPARLRSPSDASTRCDVCCRARCLLPRAAASPSRPTFIRRPAVRRRGRRFFGILREPRGANSESRISRFRFAFVRVHGN
jgi:exportin-5